MEFLKRGVMLFVVFYSGVFISGEVKKDKNCFLVYEDSGKWGGISLGCTHQNKPDHQIMKILDIEGVNLKEIKEARLQIFLGTVDYSEPRTGFTENIIIKINGKELKIPLIGLSKIAGAYKGVFPPYQWIDFIIPVNYLKEGENRIIIHKGENSKDDFIYIGIDNSIERGKSFLSLDGGKSWTNKKLNMMGAKGEYMIRLALLKEKKQDVVEIEKGNVTADINNLVQFVDEDEEGVYLELDGDKILTFSQIKLEGVEGEVIWKGKDGREMGRGNVLNIEREKPYFVIVKRTKPASQVKIFYCKGYLPKSEEVSPWYIVKKTKRTDICKGVEKSKTENSLILKNEFYEVVFKIKPHLELERLVTCYGEDVIRYPHQSKIFAIKVNDKLFEAKDFNVKDINVDKEKVSIELELSEIPLSGELSFEIKRNNPEFVWRLELENKGREEIRFKSCFPHIGGILLGNKERNNWYLYPLYGGFISNKDCRFSLIYGAEESWWQMLDVFNPEKGYGILLRNTDTEGKYKNIFLMKGLYPEITRVRSDENRNPKERVWHEIEDLFEKTKGVNFGFGSQMKILKPAERYKFDDVILEVHGGDWHRAMEKYSLWAHSVWKWSGPKKLIDVYHYFMLHPFYDYDKQEKIFFREWEKYKDKIDMVEIGLWWEPNKEGPWEIPVKKIMEDPKYETFKKRFPYAWEKDPETREWVYNCNRGDYEYRKAWGGLEGLREYIEGVKKKGILTALYTSYNLVCASTQTGKKYGREYGKINPISEANKKKIDGPMYLEESPKEYVTRWASYNMCCDNSFWPEYFSSIVERIVKDTDVESVRLDEIGYWEEPCWSDKHTHIISTYPGEDVCLQEQTMLVKKVREKLDKINKDVILTSEFLGYDYLASNLNGALCYYIGRTLRPGYFGFGAKGVPINLFRFYFPECKQIEWTTLLTNGAKREIVKNISFFNGMAIGGVLGKLPWKVDPIGYMYDDRRYEILKENSDAFNGEKLIPLIPTLQKNVYANMFSDGTKEIITVYNDTGFTKKVKLEVEDKPGFRYVNLLDMEAMRIFEVNGRSVVELKIKDKGVGCVGKFVKRIKLTRADSKIHLEILNFEKNKMPKLTFGDRNNKVFKVVEVDEKDKTFEYDDRVKWIKLFEEGYLRDVIFLDE